MKRGISIWSVLVTCGLLLYFIGLFFAPEHKVWGKPFYVWPIRAGELLFGLGAAIGVIQAVIRRVSRAVAARRWVDEAGDEQERLRRKSVVDQLGAGGALAAAGIAGYGGPTANVDGTPMLDGGMVDVMGKTYGDTGTSFDHHASTGLSDSDAYSSTDSSDIGGMKW